MDFLESRVKNILTIHDKVRTLSLPKELGGNGVIILDRVMMERFYLKGGTLSDEIFEQMLADYEADVATVSEGAVQSNVEASFAQQLLQNLQQCASLPDHVLREIVAANKRGKLGESLKALKESVGNCLPSHSQSSDADVVIVAIDHTGSADSAVEE